MERSGLVQMEDFARFSKSFSTIPLNHYSLYSHMVARNNIMNYISPNKYGHFLTNKTMKCICNYIAFIYHLQRYPNLHLVVP